MLGQVLSLRFIETNSVCQKCTKLLHTRRTVNVRLKNHHTARNSEHMKNNRSTRKSELNQATKNRETESTVLEDHFRCQNGGLKYNSRSDVSLKLSKWPSSVTTSQRNYGIPVAFNCYNQVQTSNSTVRNHQVNIDKCAFHTSSVHFDEDTSKRTPDLNETTDSIQKDSSITKEANQSHNDDDGETGVETDLRSIVKTKSVDIDSEKQASRGTQANATMDETEQMSKKVDEIVSANNTVSLGSGELTQFDSDKQIKEFLNENDMVLKQGHTCFTTSCPKLGKWQMKRQQKEEGERLFINCTSGELDSETAPYIFYSGNFFLCFFFFFFFFFFIVFYFFMK